MGRSAARTTRGPEVEPYGTQPRAPEPPEGPGSLVDDGLGADATRPQAPRWHGGIRDPGHPEFFETSHRSLPETADLEGQPERHLVVDDYDSQVRGPGRHTQASVGGIDPSPKAGVAPLDAPGSGARLDLNGVGAAQG